MAESSREVWARAAAANIVRQDQMNIDNKSDKVYLPRWEPRHQQQQQLEQQKRTMNTEELQLEEKMKLAREAIVWVVRRVGSRPTSRSFLNLALSLLSAMRSPTVHHLLRATWHFKVRYGQSVIAEALAGVTEEDVVAYVEDLVRGNIDILRCKDIPALLPDVHSLRTNEGAVVIRHALKRECNLSNIAQEKEWAKDRLEDAMYREYVAEKEAALAGLDIANASARAFRSRSLTPDSRRRSTRRTDYLRRSRSLSTGSEVVDTIEKLPVPTPLDDDDYKDIWIAEPPNSSRALPTRRINKKPIPDHADECRSSSSEGGTPDAKTSPSLSSSTQESDTPGAKARRYAKSPREEPSSMGVKICPPLSSSDEQAAPTPPLTPPRMSPPAVSNQPPFIEPIPLDLKAPSPSSPPRTSSLNPLGGMFNAELNQPCVVFVANDILCSERVMNDRRKAKKVLRELEDGCLQAETMEWIIRGLRSPRAKRDLAKRLHGLEFLGPQWGAPMYKTGKGVRRLLKGVARNHEAGARFVICASSSCSDSGAKNVPIITGVLSPPPDALTSNISHGVQPVMDGEVPGLENWVNANTCGNLDDGSRLWTWVY